MGVEVTKAKVEVTMARRGGVGITDRLRVPLKIKDSYRNDSQVALRISR